MFLNHNPGVDINEYRNGSAPGKSGGELPYLSNEELSQYLHVPDDILAEIAKSHAAMVADIPAGYPKKTFKGDGVVIASGGKYMPVAIVTLRMLRRVSPTIPVEIFVSDQREYEHELCTKVAPQLNAKCFILSELFGYDFTLEWELRTYQLKAMAILASSFERVLFLDADSMPVRSVEPLFEQEPFKSHGYVLWPDYWCRTVSTHFYNVTGITLGDRVRGDLTVTDPSKIPQADRKGAMRDKANESGQILVDKRRHLRSLLLAVYYNLLGPKVYYALIMQAGPGEGDKDTFFAAAHVLGEGDDVYHVKSGPTTPGIRIEKENGEADFDGTGMAQVVPLDDYNYHVTHTITDEHDMHTQFLHINKYKLNPRLLFADHQDWYTDGQRVRILGYPSAHAMMFDGSDPELRMFEEMKWLVCDEKVMFEDWRANDVDIDDMCGKVQQHLEWLRETTNL